MKSRFENIVELFKRAYGGELSPEERGRWEKLMVEESWRKVWEDLESGTLARESGEEAVRFSGGEGFEEFRRRCRASRNRRRWRLCVGLGAAAAVLVGVINVAFWWWSSTNEGAEVLRPMVAQGIFPERNGARLLLGNGDTVVVADGMQVVQGSGRAKVEAKDGSLAYAEDSVREEVVYNELMVPVGGESFVMLEDSSRVWLNADSRLRYPSRFEGEERRVELEGEAYFEVRRGERPFVVETSRGDVRVLGTSFDVRAYGDEAMTATLVTGRVRYEGEGEKVTLAPGEQVRVSDGGKVEKRQVDVEEYVGWREGVYVFDKRPLADIMRDLERWYGVDIVFMTEELKGLPFTGYVERYDKIDTFLDLLRSTGELTYSVDDKRIYLMRK